MAGPEATWRAFLEQGRFMLQRGRTTGKHFFYPRFAEPGTGSEDFEWVEATGNGTVHAVTIVRKKNPADSYNVVLVDLAEGPRLMSRVDGIDNDAVHIGMGVEARIVQEEAGPTLVFVPA